MVRLERDTVLAIGVGLLCVFAIANAAGTLDSVQVPEGQGLPGVSAGGDANMSGAASNGSEASGRELVSAGGSGISGRITMCVRPLTGLTGLLLYFGPVLFVFYLLARRYNPSASMLAGYAASPFVVLGYFFLTACPTAGGGMPGDAGGQSPLEGVAGTELLNTTNISPVIPLALFGLSLLGLVFLFYTYTDDEVPPVDEEDELEDTSVEELGRAAGAAADRLEERNADVDNEVYRAWSEMTDLLEVPDPETSTPGSFASAAITAGIESEYVTELTRLFEEVRYGHKDPSAREAHALEIFRQIESEYAPAQERTRIAPEEAEHRSDNVTMNDDTDAETGGTE